MWICDVPLQNPLPALIYVCSLPAKKIMCDLWATYFLPITLCKPKKGNGKLSALRKLLDATQDRLKDAREAGATPFLQQHLVSSPNPNKVKILSLVKKICGLWATYSFSN